MFPPGTLVKKFTGNSKTIQPHKNNIYLVQKQINPSCQNCDAERCTECNLLPPTHVQLKNITTKEESVCPTSKLAPLHTIDIRDLNLSSKLIFDIGNEILNFPQMAAMRWKSNTEFEQLSDEEMDYGIPEPQIKELRSRKVVSYNTEKMKVVANSITAYTFEIVNDCIESKNEMASLGILTMKHPLRNKLRDLSELSEHEIRAYLKAAKISEEVIGYENLTHFQQMCLKQEIITPFIHYINPSLSAKISEQDVRTSQKSVKWELNQKTSRNETFKIPSSYMSMDINLSYHL